jgi:hypothetical protein
MKRRRLDREVKFGEYAALSLHGVIEFRPQLAKPMLDRG